MSHRPQAAAPAAVAASTASTASTTQASADRRAADAVIAHHAELSAALHQLVERVTDGAERADVRDVWRAREDLVGWLRAELVPHATAEEAVLYPAAAAQPAGKLLVDGMLAEHGTILGLVEALSAATSPVRAATAAGAIAAVFGTHLTKENDLVLPLVLGGDQGSLAELLEGMHSLLGQDGTGDCGHTHPSESRPSAHLSASASAPVAVPASGSGCGGACGCGGNDAAGQPAEAPVLTIDPRLDVREVPHERRHATVLSALEAVPAGGALVLVAPHAPVPLLTEIGHRYPGQFAAEWLQEGPAVWQVRLCRTPVAA